MHDTNDRLAITIYSTKSYAYAMREQAGLALAALRYDDAISRPENVVVIIAGDDSDEVKTAAEVYRAVMPAGIEVRLLNAAVELKPGGEPHNSASNLVIAKLQQAALHEALRWGADQVWSLESDVLPPGNALRVLRDVLRLDKGWYGVAMATYPNTAFLGGRGSPHRHIFPNVYPDERSLSRAVKAGMEQKNAREKHLRGRNEPPTQEDIEHWRRLDHDIEQCPPKGNVFTLNAAGWRPRGWLTEAYPGVGLGAIVPTDWVGMGCTLLSRKAVEIANWTGYNGDGTQDLWLCWKCWNPAAIRMAVVPHVVCSHVKRVIDRKTKTGVLRVYYGRHELGGAQHGHLRMEERPYMEVREDFPPAAAAGKKKEKTARPGKKR